MIDVIAATFFNLSFFLGWLLFKDANCCLSEESEE